MLLSCCAALGDSARVCVFRFCLVKARLQHTQLRNTIAEHDCSKALIARQNRKTQLQDIICETEHLWFLEPCLLPPDLLCVRIKQFKFHEMFQHLLLISCCFFVTVSHLIVGCVVCVAYCNCNTHFIEASIATHNGNRQLQARSRIQKHVCKHTSDNATR
jgi:hypothetical protein